MLGWILLFVLVIGLAAMVYFAYTGMRDISRGSMPGFSSIINLILKRKYGASDKLMPKKSYKQNASLEKTLELFSAPEYAKIYKSAPTAITLADIPMKEKYAADRSILKINLHNGQLKLFLTELQFLTKVLPSQDTSAFIVYAGSSPSHKMAYLSSLFPAAKFIFIDPNEHYVMYPNKRDQYSDEHISDFLYFKTAAGNRFELNARRVNMHILGIMPRSDEQIGDIPANISEIIGTTNYKFYVIEDYMTTQLATSLAGLWNYNNVYFISDVRSKSEEGLWPADRDIIWNNAMTYCWLDELRPREFMLKFRPPYEFNAPLAPLPYMIEAFEDCRARGIDMLADYAAKRFIFIKPQQIWIQAFAPSGSSESRFVGTMPRTGAIDTAPIDIAEYEDKFYYYNTIQRPFGWHTTHEDCLDRDIGIDRCGDCAIMCAIFAEYYRKYYGAADSKKIKEDIKNLLESIKRTLRPKFSFHGRFFVPFDTISGPDRLRNYFNKLNAK